MGKERGMGAEEGTRSNKKMFGQVTAVRRDIDMAHCHAEMKRRRRLDAKKIYAFASLREAKIDERKHAFYCKRILDNGLRLSFGCMEMVFWGCQRVSASASGSVSRRRSDDQAFSAFLKLSRVRVFQFVAILKFKLELTLARNLN
uniref:Rubrerythrin domain-containing protein n=1 Tax=Ascaris lumbricoides TaxID=6252 RepID=A0A0M3I146_ASCLU